MGMLDFLSGGVGGKLAEGAMDLIKGRFPSKMSEADEKGLEMDLLSLNNNHVKDLEVIANQDRAEYNTRIKEMEGTAADLKTIPIIGPIIIFLRGMQRPVWGFATLFMDFKWFSGGWALDEQQTNAMYLINLLVLGFLFGERAIKNLEPLIMKILAK